MKVNAALNLGLLQFEVEDIFYYFGRKTVTGPFLIIERRAGLCLETEMRAENGWKPVLAPINGRVNQQWLLKKESQSTREIGIISAINGMVLDRTDEEQGHVDLLLWRDFGKKHQRWNIEPISDKLGWILQSVLDQRVLDVGKEPEKWQEIWVWERHEMLHQQFLILPIGKIPQ